MPESKIRIAIVDDHKIVRDGIRAILFLQDDIEIAGESADAEDMLAKIKSLDAHILLVDLMLPGMDGIELAEILKKRMPELKIIVLTSNTDETSIIRCIQAGV